MEPERPCHYIRQRGYGEVLIPGCYGAAIYGIERCTCKGLPWQREIYDLKEEIAKLKTHIEELNEVIDAMSPEHMELLEKKFPSPLPQIFTIKESPHA